MGKYKFLSLFKTFSSAEKSDFKQFLQQHFRKDSKATDFYEYLLGCPPKTLDLYASDASRIPNAIFTDKQGHLKDSARKDILNAFEQLYHKMAPKFLVRPGFQWDKWEDQLAWLEVLEQRGLEKEYRQQIERSFKDICLHEKKSTGECIKALAIAHKCQQHIFANLSQFKPIYIENCLKTIHQLSAVIQWKTACDLLNTGIYREQPLPIVLPTRTDENEINPHLTLLSLYQLTFEALHQRDEMAFDRAKALFKNKAKYLDRSEMQLVMRYLLNFQSEKQRHQQNLQPSEVHDLHKIADQNDIFKQKGILENGLLGNIADAACTCDAFEWLSYFLEKHKPYITNEQRPKMQLLVDATIAFAKKEFDTVIKIEKESNFSSLTDQLRIKMHALRSAYELKEELLVRDLCRKLERSANAQSSSRPITAVMNFAKIIKKMAHGRTTKAELIELISKTKPLYHHLWIKEKLATYRQSGA